MIASLDAAFCTIDSSSAMQYATAASIPASRESSVCVWCVCVCGVWSSCRVAFVKQVGCHKRGVGLDWKKTWVVLTCVTQSGQDGVDGGGGGGGYGHVWADRVTLRGAGEFPVEAAGVGMRGRWEWEARSGRGDWRLGVGVGSLGTLDSDGVGVGATEARGWGRTEEAGREGMMRRRAT